MHWAAALDIPEVGSEAFTRNTIRNAVALAYQLADKSMEYHNHEVRQFTTLPPE